MTPFKNLVSGRDYDDIPEGVDIDRLEKIYRGLVSRGLPEADIPVVMSYMIEESSADPSRDNEYGRGLLDGISFKDNMFIDDEEDSLLGRQLDAIVSEIENGDIDTVKELDGTDYGEAVVDRIYGRANPKDLNSILNGGVGWKYSEGGALGDGGMYYPMQNDDGLRKYYKGSPYALPAIEEDEDGNRRIVGMSDITSSVVNGTDQLLYDDEFLKSHTVYRGDDGRYTLLDNKVLPRLNVEGIGREIAPEELKKIMPGIEYIGGDGYRLRVARLIPGLLEGIQDKADAYGISPNLVLHRLMKEGFIDSVTSMYNESSDEEKKHFFTDGHLWQSSWSGYGELGLDDAGRHILDGRYELKDPSARWYSADNVAENEKGRPLSDVPVAEDLNSALEMVVAELAYRQDVLRKRGVPEDDILEYTNAAYNAGLNHPWLKNRELVKSKYSVPDWYGKINSLANGGNLYDGESMESSHMNRSLFWDPNGTVLIPVTNQAVKEIVQQQIEPVGIQPNQYEVSFITPQLQEMIQMSKSQPAFARELPEDIIVPNEAILQKSENVRDTLLQRLGQTPTQLDNVTQKTLLNNSSIQYSPEAAFNESIVLGDSENQAIANAMKNLPKNDADIRALQQMLFDEKYYDTSKYIPKITAKTEDEVKALQQMLYDNGYDLGKYGVDGKLGNSGSYTRRAWEQYIKDHPDEAMRAYFVDGDFGKESKAAYRRFLEEAYNAGNNTKSGVTKIDSIPIPQIAVPGLSMEMYSQISPLEKGANLVGTVIPSHVGAYINKIAAGDNDATIGDIVESAQKKYDKEVKSGDEYSISVAAKELLEARKLLKRNKLNRKGLSSAEEKAVMSYLTFRNNDAPITYSDYVQMCNSLGIEPGSWIGTERTDNQTKNSVYDLMNAFEDANGGVKDILSGDGTVASIINAEYRIAREPNRGRLGGYSWRVLENGDIEISDRLEATEEKAAVGKNDNTSYSSARNFFPRSTTATIHHVIPGKRYNRFVQNVMRKNSAKPTDK